MKKIKNIWYYIQGWTRFYLYYSKTWNKLLPLHIYEQIAYRIFVMDKECYNNGECNLCGCSTPALQMANKPCDKPCYPAMQNSNDWEIHKRVANIEFRYWDSSRPREYDLRITKRSYEV